ncbi:DUF3987 domain-containing protein [Formosa sp. S-31]|uniref:DUF3987 domain-containing protein n=1 Tax=Formosa sp. S-31 TaxID=2790949 RepID=UPI003EB9C502
MYSNTKEIKQKIDSLILSDFDKAKDKLGIILDCLPTEYKSIINESFIHKRIPKEYMLSSILFTMSSAIGLTFYLDVFGYKNYGNLYFTIIGSRGDAKSEAIKIATQPLKHSDDNDYNDYVNELSCQADDTPAIRKQNLIQNASIEAAHKVHSDNPNGVGLMIDEIFALVEKMANPSSRDGIAWRNFLLEGYTNGYVDISRKTTESFRINETYISMLGGLQHQFLNKLFSNGNLESGFIDRLLFTLKLTSNNTLSAGKISQDITIGYQKSIKNVLEYKRQSEKLEETKKQFRIEITKEAEVLLFNYLQGIIKKQIHAKPIIKEYMSKMQISVYKLCVVLFMIRHSKKSTFASSLTKEDVNLAIQVNEFYFHNFKYIIEQHINIQDKKIAIDEVIALAKQNNASQKAVVEVTGLHKGTISKKWNKN